MFSRDLGVRTRVSYPSITLY